MRKVPLPLKRKKKRKAARLSGRGVVEILDVERALQVVGDGVLDRPFRFQGCGGDLRDARNFPAFLFVSRLVFGFASTECHYLIASLSIPWRAM